MIQILAKLEKFTILYLLVQFECNWAENVANVDMLAFESALLFSQKWLASPKFYISLMLPIKSEYKINDAIKLTKTIFNGLESTPYLLFNLNWNIYNNEQPSQNELQFFPFDVRKYDNGSHCMRFMNKNNTTRQKHFLFYTRTRKNIRSDFALCRVRFDSYVVVYYRFHHSKLNPYILFEEIY